MFRKENKQIDICFVYRDQGNELKSLIAQFLEKHTKHARYRKHHGLVTNSLETFCEPPKKQDHNAFVKHRADEWVSDKTDMPQWACPITLLLICLQGELPSTKELTRESLKKV